MMPIGEKVGSHLTRTRKVWLIILVCFIIGVIITVAEPDLKVLADQVPIVQSQVLIYAVAVGIGLFLVLSFLRILLQIRLSYLLLGFYALMCLDAALIGSFYRNLEETLRISKKGAGIAFSIPISGASGFCGRLMELTAHHMKEGRVSMAENFKYTHELVVTIVTRGNAELVKEAAKKSGAMGGTMVHGLGLGGEEAAKFLGISIQEEKDVVLIVVKKADCPEVMKAIVQECGIETEARGICFSLPVDSAVGLR